jgi:hypothetical protein
MPKVKSITENLKSKSGIEEKCPDWDFEVGVDGFVPIARTATLPNVSECPGLAELTVSQKLFDFSAALPQFDLPFSRIGFFSVLEML